MTGLSPVLLRAWERRHGLLAPQRTDGGHRMYTDEDVRVLSSVRELLDEGRSIGEVTALGRRALLARTPSSAAPSARRAEAHQDGAAPTHPGVAGWVQALVTSAVELDARDCERALDAAFAALAPERVMSDVLGPALFQIGELWATGACSVAGEHLVSGSVIGRVRRLLDSAAPSAGPAALCACFPEEQHVLGSLAVAYGLARRGYRVTWLGAALPFEDLDLAIDRLRPELVLLSVTRAALLEAHCPRLVDTIRRRAGTRFLVGGSGVPDGAASVDALAAAGATVNRAMTLAELDGALEGPRRAARARRPGKGRGRA